MVVESNYRLPSLKVAGVAAIALTITMLDALPAVAVCSNDFLIGEDLRGTIHSAAAHRRAESPVKRAIVYFVRSGSSPSLSRSGGSL
jgi:hypothetical protein